MKRSILITLLMLAVPAAALADSVQYVADALKSDVSEPFRYGVATDLAENLLEAQSLAPYASEQSLALSIQSVVRAIGIDNTSYVGWASTDPITWLQSTIAINPAAYVGFDPPAIVFAAEVVSDPVATPEPEAWVFIIILLVLGGSIAGYRWLRPRRLPRIVISTPYGPTTEWARRQAEINMAADPACKRRVEEHLAKELGSDLAGLEEARRRYPRAYDE